MSGVRTLIAALSLLAVSTLTTAAVAQQGQPQPPSSGGGSGGVTTQSCPISDPSCSGGGAFPDVTPDGASSSVSPGANTYAFTVMNTGTANGTFSLSASCSGAASACTPSYTSVSIAAGGSMSIRVNYTAASSGTGQVKLTATNSGNSDQGSVNVTVVAPTYTVAVTPDGASTTVNAGANSYAFKVLNSGNQSSVTYTLTPSCTGGISGCSASAGSVVLSAGQSAQVSVSYTGTGGTTGRAVLTAAYSGNTAIRDTGSVSVTVNNIYSVSVTPDGGSVVAPSSGIGTAAFTVTNTGTGSATYNLTTVCGGSPTICTVQPSVSVDPGRTDTVNVTWNASDLSVGQTVTLTAAGSPGGSDNGAVTLISPTYTVSLTAAAQQAWAEPNDSGTVNFTVHNSGNAPANYSLEASCPIYLPDGTTYNGLTGCTGPSTVQVEPGASQQVAIRFTTEAPGDSGIVRLSASASGTADTAVATLTIKMYGVVVHAGVAADTAEPFASRSVPFVVKNVGKPRATYTLSATGCPGACTVASSIAIESGDSATVPVAYMAGSGGSSGTIALTASAGAGGTAANGSATIPFVVNSYAMAIAPQGRSVAAVAGASATQYFRIANRSNKGVTFTLNRQCQGVSCSAVSSIYIAKGGQDSVPITYTAGTAGSSGRIRLSATVTADTTVRDSGWVSLAFVSTGAAIATLVNPNVGGVTERDLCITASAGPDAAAECGDLRLVHPLPTTSTLSKARTPALLFNSQHAHPYVLIAADIALPAGAGQPTQIVGKLTRPLGAPDTTITWSGGAWVPGEARRVVLPVDASALLTGLYGYTLTISTYVGATKLPDQTANGTMVVVNRRNSHFGSGWWLAGLERLYRTGNDWLWVSGDGSTRLYRQDPVDPNRWNAENIDHPDRIALEYDSVSNRQLYVRHLLHQRKVLFDSSGYHLATENQLRHRTVFEYAMTPTGARTDLLTAIHLPVPAGAPERSYLFGYVDSTLQTVTAPSVTVSDGSVQQRVTALQYYSGGNVLRYITDPHLDTATQIPRVEFLFDASRDAYTGRKDRLQHSTSYDYDGARRLSAVTIPTGVDTTTIHTTFCFAETQGLTGCRTAPTPPDSVYTTITGPRWDTTVVSRFWINGLGAPTRILNPAGFASDIAYDSTWPGLVTRVTAANGHATRAHYDARGRVDMVTDVAPYGGANAVTTYTWDDTWDFPRSITSPTQQVTILDYDPKTGNRLYQQLGQNAARRVTFGYDPSTGLLNTIQEPTVAHSSRLDYDQYGNLTRIHTPLGDTTRYLKDDIGRDTLVVSPAGRQLNPASDTVVKVRTAYDLFDRAVQSVSNVASGSFAAGDTLGPQSVIVTSDYDPEGRLLSLARTGTPNLTNVGTVVTRWAYDWAGRKLLEVAPDGMRDSTHYDRAGNPDTLFSRRKGSDGSRLVITMTYDAMNRLRTRRVPSVSYDREHKGMATRKSYVTDWDYPYFSNNAAGGWTIDEDLQTFAYDTLGNLRLARNNDAIVRRAYFPGGALRSETDSVRSYTAADTTTALRFGAHSYTIAYEYDLSGRRTKITHPAQLAPAVGGLRRDVTSYTYDDTTGALHEVHDLLGNVFAYKYDLRGNADTVLMPGGLTEYRTYDDDGQLILQYVTNGNTTARHRFADSVLRNEAFEYDARGKVYHSQSTVGLLDELTNTYSGLGFAVRSTYSVQAQNVLGGALSYTSDDAMSYDPLGNMYDRTSTTQSTNNTTYSVYGTWFNALMNQQSIASSSGTTQSNSYTFQAGVGRLVQQAQGWGTTTFEYDSAGNTVFTTQPGTTVKEQYEDRASYYGADNQLRVVDHRTHQTYGIQRRTFEEYYYDALGRRILTRARRGCANADFLAECQLSFIRRTVWDGNQELFEIQMPGDTIASVMENDVEPVRVPLPIFAYDANGNPTDSSGTGDQWVDPNPYYGIVAYTPGGATDQPLSVTRINYTSKSVYSAEVRDAEHRWIVFEPFTIVPLWNARGEADNGYVAGGVDDGGMYHSVPVAGEAEERPVVLGWPSGWYPYNRSHFIVASWHGTLLDDKRDMSGIVYRRNRYYDPSTGRFTQEDPTGLAGGLNLYGFATGDPINHADPFGLCCSSIARYDIALRVMERAQVAASTFAPDASQVADWHLRYVMPLVLGEFGGQLAESAISAGATTSGGVLTSGSLTTMGEGFSESEMAAARFMANEGYEVVLRSANNVTRTSDLLVNGVRYDVYTPRTASAMRIVSAIAKKNSQTEGIVLDLSHSKVNPADLGNLLERVRKAGGTNIRDIQIMRQ